MCFEAANSSLMIASLTVDFLGCLTKQANTKITLAALMAATRIFILATWYSFTASKIWLLRSVAVVGVFNVVMIGVVWFLSY